MQQTVWCNIRYSEYIGKCKKVQRVSLKHIVVHLPCVLSVIQVFNTSIASYSICYLNEKLTVWIEIQSVTDSLHSPLFLRIGRFERVENAKVLCIILHEMSTTRAEPNVRSRSVWLVWKNGELGSRIGSHPKCWDHRLEQCEPMIFPHFSSRSENRFDLFEPSRVFLLISIYNHKNWRKKKLTNNITI